MTPHFKGTSLKAPLYNYLSATSNIARSRVENVKIEHSSSIGLDEKSVDGKKRWGEGRIDQLSVDASRCGIGLRRVE